MLGKLKKRKRLRTHGFLKRSLTADWKKVLKNRRRKWRYELAVSYPRKVKKTRWKSKLHIIAWWTAKVVRYPWSSEKFRIS